LRQTEEDCSIGLSPGGGVGRRLGVTLVDEMHLDGTGGGNVATVVYI